jgi:hypothetical protein
MPRSKAKRRRYQPPPRKKPKASPRWYGWTILGLMFAGVGAIVVNYLGLMPGTGGTASTGWLLGGLAMIGVGFLGATRWR